MHSHAEEAKTWPQSPHVPGGPPSPTPGLTWCSLGVWNIVFWLLKRFFSLVQICVIVVCFIFHRNEKRIPPQAELRGQTWRGNQSNQVEISVFPPWFVYPVYFVCRTSAITFSLFINYARNISLYFDLYYIAELFCRGRALVSIMLWSEVVLLCCSVLVLIKERKF